MIGGSYARLDDVTLINPRPVFVPRLRLHQLMGGSHDAVVDYREILAEGVRLVVDNVTRIDAGGRKVELASGGTVGYDYLIYAVDSGSASLRVRRLRSVLDFPRKWGRCA